MGRLRKKIQAEYPQDVITTVRGQGLSVRTALMKGLLRHIFPLSLRVRFLLATAGGGAGALPAYGMVALVGYSVSFDKTTFRLLRGEGNLFFICWRDGKTALLTSISRKT